MTEAGPNEIAVRAATADDEPFLRRMLALAASLGDRLDDGEESSSIARTDPVLRAYLDRFGREGDLGFVASDAGVSIGAAWLRLGERDAAEAAPCAAKVWTREIPELVIATTPDRRGRGVGTTLLRAIVEAARGRYPAIALSVREGNPAVRLYERFGFVVEGTVTNRVGGTSLAMRRDL